MFEKRKNGGFTSSKSSLFGPLFRPIVAKQKKGQVTVFIILGILLLLTVVLIILLQQEIIKLPQSEAKVMGTEAVSDFVSQCILDVGEEALIRAGTQGGFITVPDSYLSDLSWNVALSPVHSVPLWANGNEFDPPTLGYIKDEVDRYIEENVRHCLFDAVAFDKIYDLIENSEVESTLEFKNEKTIFNVRWNILIRDKAGEVVAEIIEHQAESQIRFKSLYEMAFAIVKRELAELKVDDITQDLIALEHPKLPVAGMEFQCAQKQWQENEAKQTLKDLLRINLPSLKIKGSKYTEFPDSQPYYQNHYIWDVGYEDKDTTALFRYDDTFPLFFQVTPTSNGLMKSSRIGGEDIISFLCIQQWKFTYDVVYPVIIELRDEKSEGIFQVAFSVNVIQNYPFKGTPNQRSSSGFSQSSEEEFCLSNNYYLPIDVETYSLVENSKSGVYFKEPLEDVSINYQCAIYNCGLGSSGYNFASKGDVSGLRVDVPFCNQAIVKGEKENYLSTTEFVTTQENTIVELNLKPLYGVSLSNMEIVKHFATLRDCTSQEIEERGEGAVCLEFGDAIPLASDETAMVTFSLYEELIEDIVNTDNAELQNTNEASQTSDTSSTQDSTYAGIGSEFLNEKELIHKAEFIISPAYDEEIQEGESIQLLAQADFNYEVNAYLIDERELLGGYSGEWQASWSEISSGGNIVIHIIEANPSDSVVFSALTSNLDVHSLGVPSPEIN
jgi:hypothetical protein